MQVQTTGASDGVLNVPREATHGVSGSGCTSAALRLVYVVYYISPEQVRGERGD
jgi:hypothetical protein